MKTELLLGCGSRTEKDLWIGDDKFFENAVRLDANADHRPDIVWDLRKHPLPFADNIFDEIHAYDILEHLAYQGDYEFFFNEFNEYYRILKPKGFFFSSVPGKDSVWTWGDPSHKRTITKETLVFLDQESYKQVGKTKMSDFRNIYFGNFKMIYYKTKDNSFKFILQGMK